MNKRAARLRPAVQAPAITTEQGGTQSARERAFAAEPLSDPPLSSVWRRECIIRKDFSRPARTLFFIFTSFHTIAFVRLIRFASQTCAPCAFKNAQVCDPTLSATKKEPLGLLFCGGESGIRTHGTLEAYTRFPIVLLRPARTSLH